MDDNEIMELYFCRDESAIARTKEKYDAKCKSIALSVLGNRQDAEEAVADAYLAIWNHIGKERPASFSSYLFRVVRNQSLTKYDVVNARKRRPIRQLEELDDCIPSGFDLEKIAESADVSQIINGFLRTLSEQDRRIFVCRYFAGMEYKEITKKLGCGFSAVKMSLKRSRDKLKSILIKEGYYNE